MENEIKFALRGYVELESLLTPFGWEDITQGYLNPNNRVRQIIYPTGRRECLHTFKQRLPNGHNLEIESRITAEQYDEAWEFTVERVTKRRIPIEYGDLVWDIDFYRWSYPWFVLAEVEMPPNMERPETIPPQLQEYLVYEVPRDDGRFAARRLADESHVRRLAGELGL